MTQSLLTKDKLEEAIQFLGAQARPLEKLMYAYEFEEGSLEAVLEELANYQNSDGGFGNALEPDIRAAASSALVTTVALQHLSHLGRGVDCKLVAGAVRYLIDTYNAVQPNGWDIVPKEVESAPRAPWWNYNAAHNGWGNPGIEIAGYLFEYADAVPPKLLDSITSYAIKHINEVSSRKDFHELLCCLRFADRAPETVLLEVKPALDEMVSNCVTTDSEGWNAYCLMPLQVAENPESIYYGKLSDSVESNLAYTIEKQQSDGAWHPAWSWGQYEDAWTVAQREWKGVITLDTLRKLHVYDAIEL